MYHMLILPSILKLKLIPGEQQMLSKTSFSLFSKDSWDLLEWCLVHLNPWAQGHHSMWPCVAVHAHSTSPLFGSARFSLTGVLKLSFCRMCPEMCGTLGFMNIVTNMAIREVNGSIALIWMMATQHLNIPAQRPTLYIVDVRGPLLRDIRSFMTHCTRSIYLWLSSHPNSDTVFGSS